jgi:hypothetical protein
MDELDLSEYYEYLEGVVKKPKARKAKGKGRAK